MDRVLASQNSYHLLPAKRYENTAGTGPAPLTLQARALTVAPWFIGHERLPRLGGGGGGSISAPKTTRGHN